MQWKRVFTVLLILGLVFAISDFSQAHAQAQYYLNIEGFMWNHSTISVLIVPPGNESWWNPSYLNDTLRAIGEWDQAIFDFASNYSTFAYLSSLRLVPTVSHVVNSGFDVYIFWTETSLNASSDEIGLTQIWYDSSGIITNSTISLASKEFSGYVLDDVDMQNVALHELGHSLGIGHTNCSGDVMYPEYTPTKAVKGLSTLDLYGVSTVFQWMSKSQFNPAYRPQASPVCLPPSIPYQYLPISYENLPPPTSSAISSPTLYQNLLTYIQALLTYVRQFITRPEFSIPLLIAISALLVTEILFARVKTPKNYRNDESRISASN